MKKGNGKKTQYAAKAGKTKATKIQGGQRQTDSQQSTGTEPDEEKRSEEQKVFNDWTVMVYLAGDNNLAEEMVFALKCMKLVGSSRPDAETGSRQCQVFALYDGGVGPATLTIDDKDFPPKGVQDGEGLLKEAESARAGEAKRDNKEASVDLKTSRNTLDDFRSKIAEALEGSDGVAAQGLRLLRQRVEEEHTQIQERAERIARAAKENKLPEFVESVQAALVDFVGNTIREHPAEHYLLVLSGHGSGAVGDFLTGNSRPVGLSIPDLKEALIAIQEEFQGETYPSLGKERLYLPEGKIDILGLDSCVMGMAEVAYEVRECVQYLIGAEGYEPNAGWPYDRILALLRGSSVIRPKTLAERIVAEYNDYYLSDYALADVSTDLAALDLSRIVALARSLGRSQGLSSILGQALSESDVQAAMKEDLEERLEQLLKDPDAQEAVRAAVEAHLLDPETPGHLWTTFAQYPSLNAGINKTLKSLFSDTAVVAEILNSCSGGVSDVPFDVVTGPETRNETTGVYRAALKDEIGKILRESKPLIEFDDNLISEALASAAKTLLKDAEEERKDKRPVNQEVVDLLLEVLRDQPETREGIIRAVGDGREFTTLLRDALDNAALEVLHDAFNWDAGLARILCDVLKDSPVPVDIRIRSLVQDAVLLAHWKAQGYKDEQHVDVLDFCDLLKQRMEEILAAHENLDDQDSRQIANVCIRIIRACQQVQESVEGGEGIDPLVLEAAQSGAAFQHSRGISIFFPWAEVTDATGFKVMEHYSSALQFAGDTHWDEFVKQFHTSTQRAAREGPGDPHPSALNRLPGLLTSSPGHPVAPLSVRLAKALSEKFALEIGTRLAEALTVRLGTALNARLGTALNARLGTALNARLGTALNARLGTALNARLGTALNARLGTELNARLGTALNARLGAALNLRLGTALNARLGTALNARLGTALNARLGTALNARLGTALNARLGTALNARLGTALNARLGTALNARLSDGGGGVEKIASMKNPATEWVERRAGQKQQSVAGAKG